MEIGILKKNTNGLSGNFFELIQSFLSHIFFQVDVRSSLYLSLRNFCLKNVYIFWSYCFSIFLKISLLIVAVTQWSNNAFICLEKPIC